MKILLERCVHAGEVQSPSRSTAPSGIRAVSLLAVGTIEKKECMLSCDSDIIITAGNMCGNKSKVVRLNEEETV